MKLHSTLLSLAQGAKERLYTTSGKFSQQVFLSLAFERAGVDLSILAEVDPETRDRLLVVIEAFARGDVSQEDIAAAYLEFFPRPAEIDY